MKIWEGYVFWGNDINSFETENEAICMNACLTFPLCTAIAYKRYDKMCHLKDKEIVFNLTKYILQEESHRGLIMKVTKHY